ncbi:MAG TPA: AsmA family protein [Reyranella sp.]|nr:AsmA family protein [Reyranella sp.]
MRHLKKIGLIVAAVLAPLVAAVWALPHLIDVEAYKPGLIEAVRDATGRELVIDGPMKLTLFPVPGIGAGTVRFSNAVGAKGAQMVDVRWVAVTPAWGALLRGKVAVGTLTLYRPTIVLETDEKGRPNWEFAPGGNINQPDDAPNRGLHLAMGTVEIVNGTISYTDPASRKAISADNVNGSATVRSFDGPFEIDGRATVNDVPLKLVVSVGPDTDKGHKASLRLEVSSGQLDFEGAIATVSPDTKLQGHLSVKTGVLSDFVNSVVTATGAPRPAFDTSGAGRLAFEGDIDIDAQRIAARDFAMTMGKDEARGSLSLAYAPTLSLTGNVALTHLGIGKWLKVLERPIDFTPDPVKAATMASSPEEAAARTARSVVGPSLWATMDAHVTASIDEADYNGDAIRGLEATVDMAKGVIVVPRLKATMPGNLTIDADASGGTFSLSAAHLRDTLQWLGMDVSGVPAGKLETLKVEGRLGQKGAGLDLSSGVFSLDGTPGAVSGTLFLKVPMAAALDVRMDQFDLDAYMPPPSATPAPAAPPPKATVKPPAATVTGDAPSLALKLDLGKLVYRGETLSKVTGTTTLQGNLIKLDGIQVGDLLGAKLALGGQVADFGTVPRFDLTFNVVAPDTDKLLDYAGLPKFMNGKIGAGTASGSVAGTREAVTLRNVAARFLNTDARVAGTLNFSSPPTFDLPTFNLQSPEASALISTASGHRLGGLGPMTAVGSLKGSPERSLFTGTLTVRGSEMTGTLDSTLGARPRLAANLKVARTLDIDSLLGIQDDSAPAPPPPVGDEPAQQMPRSRQATSKPINLAALRAFDATLTVSAKAMSVSALKVDYADLQASLTNGVFRIAKLTGQFYKGAVDFAGTIDASGQALAVDATGTLLGLHLDEMLRGTVGSNIFGSSDFRVAVDGKLDATSIRLTGRGASAADLRESLGGTAQVSGSLHAGMASGARSLAKFATGLGSLFSDQMAFDSLILNAFINHPNALAGGVTMGNGTITLQNQTVQGQGATAVLSGQSRMADGTTNTSIQVTSGNRQYVARVTGKLSSPDINAAGR